MPVRGEPDLRDCFARWRTRGWQLALPRVLGREAPLRFGAGIGGRFYTNFGPLRVDVATPLNPRPGDGKVALYISIGQAF